MYRYTIISDLHLGAGDALEDFLVWGSSEKGPDHRQRPGAVRRMDERFRGFVAHQLGAAGSARPHLLLLGDIFDMWQVRHHREKYATAMLRIAEAHPGFFTGLREWIGAGGEITYVLGNHDQPLVDPDAWGMLREIVPTINRCRGGEPIHHYADEACGLYAEHGHQWDPFNRMKNLQKPDADCAGHRIVRYVVNRVEELVPLIDKGADVLDLLELLWRAGAGEGLIPWREVVTHLVRLIGRASGPACLLVEELHRFIHNPDRAPDFGMVARRQHGLRERALAGVLNKRRTCCTGPLPSNLRFLACGHTHLAALREGGEVTLINPGTWRPIVHRPAKSLAVRQRMTYATLEASEGAWRGELREWAGR